MNIFRRPVALHGAMEGASSFSIWLSHMQANALLYLFGAVCVVLTNIAEVAVPKTTQLMIDLFRNTHLLDADKTSEFRKFFFILAALVLAQFIGRIGWRLTLGQQTHKVAARMKSLIWNRAKFLPRARLENDLSAGELMNVATGDVGIARFVFGFTLVGTVDFIFLLILTTIAMLSINVELTLWTLMILPVLPFFLDKLARTESVRHKESQKSLSSLTDLAAQTVSTIRLQRVTQTGPFWISKLIKQAEDYRQKRVKVVQTSLAFIPLTGIAPLISYVILLSIGVKKVFDGELSIGSFVAMQSYIFMIQGPMIELGTMISEWQRAFTSLDRVRRIYNESESPQLRSGGDTLKATANVLSVKHVTYHYPGSSKEVVKDINFTLNHGERLGIKGTIGTGKSTLALILSGLERDFTGEVLLFGKDIKSYSHEALRQTIAVVPQKPFLFADSIRNNIKLHRELTDDEIWKMLDIAGIKEDVEAIPEKLDAKLGEWGINLSGGQKQRMTLARALAQGPSILVMDDCLSAVDTITEEKIIHNLDRALKNLTTIWVAHRHSTLRFCDQIIDLDLGTPGGTPS